MKVRHICTMVGIAVSACAALWRLPKAVEAVDQAKQYQDSHNKQADRINQLLQGLTDSKAVLADLEARTAHSPNAPQKEDGLLIFAGDNASLTPQQREQMLREAKRLMPKTAGADDAKNAGAKGKKSRPSGGVKVTVHRSGEPTTEQH